MVGGDPLIVYKCAVCHVFFDNYSQATTHLGIKHSSACLKLKNSTRSDREDNNQRSDNGDLIKSVEFPQSNISLERLPSSKLQNRYKKTKVPNDPAVDLTDSTLETSSSTTVLNNARGRRTTLPHKSDKRSSTKGRSRQEIKLDSLKAGEIETLIKDLYSDSTASKSSKESGLPFIRKSNRKVKERFKKNYGELDSSDEEIIRTGSRTKANELDKHCNSSDSDSDYSLPESNVCDTKYGNKQQGYGSQKSNDDDKKLSKSKPARPRQPPSPPQPFYQCDICPKKFLKRFAFKEHMNFHKRRTDSSDPKKCHVCPICLHRFTKQTKLHGHFLTHLENNPFKCKFPGCNRSYTSNYHLLQHVTLHTDRMTFKCEKCPASYSHKKILRRHEKRFHSENSKETYKVIKKMNYFIKSAEDLVPTKPKGTNEEADFKFEVESIHLQDRIIATDDQEDIHIKGERLSPVRGPSPCSVLDHENDFNGEGEGESESNDGSKTKDSGTEAPVDLIDLILSDPAIIKIQETRPDIEKWVLKIFSSYRNVTNDFKCQICSWSGRSIYTLQYHLKTCHDTSTDNRILPESGAASTEDNLINLTCGSCGFQSKSLNHLSTHIAKQHTKGNQFHCTFCGVRFPKKSLKDQHEQKVHLTEKKFCCDKCDAKYTSGHTLRAHIRAKHDPTFKKRVFKCGICNATFIQEHSFRVHKHLHSNNELTTCKICKQTCSTIYTLKRHIRLIHLGTVNIVEERQKKKILKSQVLPTVTNDSSGQIVNGEDSGNGNLTASTAALDTGQGVNRADSSEILGF